METNSLGKDEEEAMQSPTLYRCCICKGEFYNGEVLMVREENIGLFYCKNCIGERKGVRFRV